MRFYHLVALFLLSAGSAARADSIEINLSNDVAQFQYIAPAGRAGEGHSEFHFGFLYNDSNNTMFDAGLMVSNSDDRSSLATFGVGAKAIAATIGSSTNTAALALGGQIRLAPTADRKLAFVGQVYVAPDIVTFGDAKRYVQTGVRVEYEIMPQASTYLGYRKIKFGLEAVPAYDVVPDEGAHIGVRIAF